MLRSFSFSRSPRLARVSPCPPPTPKAILSGRAVSCMVYLLCHRPRAQRSSRNMQAADSRPGLFSNVVERDCTSQARRPTLPCATRTEPRESDFSGYPRWIGVLKHYGHLHPQIPCSPKLRRDPTGDTHVGSELDEAGPRQASMQP